MRLQSYIKRLDVNSFNPRIRKGCARQVGRRFALLRSVSIHASVKDATYHKAVQGEMKRGFNPRIRKGCD